MIDNKFNSSASKDQKLQQAEEHNARLKRIEKISDQMLRDRLLKQYKENERLIREARQKAERKEEHAVQKSIQRNIAPKHELHLKPAYAILPPPRKQESYIRDRIRNSVGLRLDKQIEKLKNSLDKDLDRSIEHAYSLKRDNINSQQAQDQTRTKSLSRSHGRSRIRRR